MKAIQSLSPWSFLLAARHKFLTMYDGGMTTSCVTEDAMIRRPLFNWHCDMTVNRA